MSLELPILHFNDVYRVGPQKLSGKGTVDVTQFASMLDSLRDAWPLRGDGRRDGLVLFSGDLFSPSVESSVTRGTHMVPVINELAPDVAVTGNHEFDFGYPQLTKLITETKFPWLLSNIVDEATSKVPEHLHEFHIIERCGVRIGFIGLVEMEWIATVPSWPPNFKYRDMAEVAFELSKRLRDPDGENRCDLIIALTHSRLPNDISLAKRINALSPSCRPADFASTHGADILLGGHDHFYYVSRGITSWENYDENHEVLGAELDRGDVLVVKSGTDFRDLSEILLDLEDSPNGSTRRKVIKGVRGKRHETQPGSVSSQRLQDILTKTLASVSDTLQNPIAKVVGPLDLRSEVIRVGESASGNWFADVIYHEYGKLLRKLGVQGSHGVLLCAGALRGDTSYGPGNVTLGDIMEILPFDDSIVALELDGRTIWEALESGLARWPAHEGRFPVISGFRVTWDSQKPPGQRVLRIALPVFDRATENLSGKYEEIPRDHSGRKYAVVTREYMAEGYDGYACLKGTRTLIDHEQGQMMSSITQEYLAESGSSRMMIDSTGAFEKLAREDFQLGQQSIKAHSQRFCTEAFTKAFTKAFSQWQLLTGDVAALLRSPTYVRMPCIFHHSSRLGCASCENEKQATALDLRKEVITMKDEGRLVVVTPAVDGRLRDVGRSM